ncbi:cytochrome c oxidase assembly protein COX16 homolog l(3)neo43 isoform X1 [Lycorma delicatula]|uniref:cytochrome c oxidase assembly protein COX16 homolog l(3)neo43 isoform X1 n=1 Tax=Lycorma delicatula TaxID=130591 RepID=UPI003F5169E1
MSCNSENNTDGILFDQVESNKKKLVSEEWLFIDKTESNVVLLAENIHNNYQESEKLHSNQVLSKLKPYVPLGIEEISVTTNLEMWSNRNVRLTGVLKFDEIINDYYLESINEPDGIYRVLVDFKHVEYLPLLNERIQVFGEIMVNYYKNYDSLKPVINVLFFRNMESGDLIQHLEAVETMRPFIPFFIKNECKSTKDDF